MAQANGREVYHVFQEFDAAINITELRRGVA
jgi:hypothetical protein